MLNDIKDALHSSFLIVIYKFYQLLLPAYCYNIQDTSFNNSLCQSKGQLCPIQRLDKMVESDSVSDLIDHSRWK